MKHYLFFFLFGMCYAQESWKITTDQLKSFALEDQLQKEIQEKLLHNTKELLEDVQSRDHPLYGLNECIERDCNLSRLKNPNVRAEFSKEVVEELSKRYIGNESTNRTIAFLGSGSFLSEAEIIVQMALKECKNLTLVFIDYIYQEDIATLNDQQKKGATIEKIIPTLKNKAIPSFLKLMSPFSKNNFTFAFYSSLPDYIRAAQKTSYLFPSTAISIDPFQMNVKETIADSLLLLNTALLPGGMSFVLQRGSSNDLRVQATMVINTVPKEIPPAIMQSRELVRQTLLCSQTSSPHRSIPDCLEAARKTLTEYEKAREGYTTFLQSRKIDIRRTIVRK